MATVWDMCPSLFPCGLRHSRKAAGVVYLATAGLAACAAGSTFATRQHVRVNATSFAGSRRQQCQRASYKSRFQPAHYVQLLSSFAVAFAWPVDGAVATVLILAAEDR